MAIASEEERDKTGQPQINSLLGEQIRTRAETTLEAAVQALLDAQNPAGWWCGELEANVTIQAEYILLMYFLGLADQSRWKDILRYIDLRQQDDGGWPIYYRGPSDLSTTIEAYVALKLAGRPADDDRMRRARTFILSRGGLPKARVFTKIWLALFGEYPWDGLPVMPPELMFLPAWAAFSIYSFSSWARGTIVPLLIVMSLQPVRRFSEEARLSELHAGLRPDDYGIVRPKPMVGWRAAFYATDLLLRRVPFPKLLRAKAISMAERWVLDHQEADGSWGGIQPPWVYSLIALNALGYDNDHPVMARSLAGMEAFGLIDDQGWRVQPCVSPVWDTGLALLALTQAGLTADNPAVANAIEWLMREQLFGPGDWQVHAPKGTPGGGWAFEFFNASYPDTDDTAIVALALHRAAPGYASVQQAVIKGVRWLEGMRSRNGAWGSFDVNNCSTVVTQIPFADFGDTVDPPTEDVTAHVLECLSAAGYGAGHPLVRDAVSYLLDRQEPDGSWWGRWGVNCLYGIGAVLPALRAAGLGTAHPAFNRAVAWLVGHQHPDGGWGETCATYDNPDERGRGPSTPSQTAWALLGMIAAGKSDHPATLRGIHFLIERQREDGTWDEPEFTGTGFPKAFMINYHLYRQYFPVLALGRWLGRGQAASLDFKERNQ